MGTNTFAYAIANTCTNTISDAFPYHRAVMFPE